MAKDDAFANYFGSGEDAEMTLTEVAVSFAKTLAGYRTALLERGISEEESFMLCRDLQETYFQFLFMGIHQHNNHE